MATYNYTQVIQVPVPFLGLVLNLSLPAAFSLPSMAGLGVPAAMQSYASNALKLYQNVVADITDFIKIVPSVAVTLTFKVGPATILNVKLVAQPTPLYMAVPAFESSLLSALSAAEAVAAVQPGAQTSTSGTSVIPVNVPVPVLTFAKPTVVGGQVVPMSGAVLPLTSAQALELTGIYLPKI